MKYKLTLITDKPAMSEEQFRKWCEVMAERMGWATDFEELDSMAGAGPILVWEDPEGATRMSVDIIQ